MLEWPARRYCAFLSLCVVALASFALLINCLVDPLWHFRGNVLTGKNFAFNERLAKLNGFLSNPDRYDCLIFGSSRATLLDGDKINGYRCYNFAFSDGRIVEYVAYASYLAQRGYRPKLIIVGVDNFEYLGGADKNVPAYVRQNADPPSFLRDYLTLDVLAFSVRTLLGLSPLPRYYDGDFSARILTSAPVYKPERIGAREAEGETAIFNAHNAADWYRRLLEVYPDSKFVFYVPPISVWKILRREEEGRLDSFLKGIHAVSQIAPVLYDFSIPSDITADTSRTYDGSHYDLVTNALIADAINSDAPRFGIKLSGLSFDDYRRRYLESKVYWSSMLLSSDAG